MADLTYEQLVAKTYGELVAMDYTLGAPTIDQRLALIEEALSNLPSNVWGYTTRTLTSGSGTTPEEIWSYSNRSLTVAPSSLTAQQVWEYSGTRSLTTSFPTVPTTSEIATAVWSNASRTITGEVTIGGWTTVGLNTITSALPGAGDFENLVKSTSHITIEGLITHGDSNWATATIPTDYAKESSLSSLASSVALEAAKTVIVQQCATSTGFATPETITTSQNAIIAACATATGFATPENVTSAKDSIVATCSTATGFATPTNISDAQTAILAGCATATGFATPANVTTAKEAIIARGDEAWATASTSGLATSENVEAVKTYGDTKWTTATGFATPQTVWEYSNRTLTAQEAVTTGTYCTRSDVERRWGSSNVKTWANIDNDNDSTKIQNQIEWAMQSAYAKINSDFASSVYQIPFDPIPSEVRLQAAALSGVELFHCRSMAATNDSPTIQRAETDYFNWKTQVLSGVEIPGATKVS